MYSVLVADDNSNIQKMVSLALKDEGIEVFAVGNGEAAVRRLSDSPPDLILADIFMPARSGYEVCEFVKRDERFQHIPVILLVGAFDPLDDEEVRRVRADGVLKKPFVPPDPLIALVKATLERVSRREPQPPPAEAAPPEPVAAQEPLPEMPEPEMPEPEESIPRAPAFSLDQADPLAFGALLEAPPESEPPVPPSRGPDEPFWATSIPDDDVAAAQLEAAGYFAMDTPAAAPAEEAALPAEDTTVREAALPDWSSLSSAAPFAQEEPQPGPVQALEPPRAEGPVAAPAEESAAPVEWPVPSEGTWPFAAGTSADVAGSPELPDTIELLGPVKRPVPEESSATPAEPPAAEEAPDSAPPAPASAARVAAAPNEGRAASFPASPQPDPALVDAVVERVLERLRPQLDEMARDVLRPVAEALLQRELEKTTERSRN